MKNQNGFSLVQVMIAIGLSGGIALTMMRIASNMEMAQSSSQSKMDELDLRTEVRMILNNDRHCRVSLAGDGPVGAPNIPVRFYKKDIDENHEGLDVELFISNLTGDARSTKKLSASDEATMNLGKIKIKSMKLLMNNGTDSNYPESVNHNDIGELRIVAERTIASGKKKEIFLKTMINVEMTTDTSGESTILSCYREKEDAVLFTYPNSCKITFSHSDNGGPYRSVALDMSDAGFAGMRLRGDVNSDDRFKIQANCTAGNELSEYLKNCSLGFGWKDSTNNNSSANFIPNASKAYDAPFDNTEITLQTGGDVNEDDSFFYRIRCPNGADTKINTYMKSKCLVCMGHSDYHYNSPEKISCRRIQNIADSSWGKIMLSGDVGADDSLYIGFFCNAEFAPIIKNWSL